jgi:tight adherence protein B
MGLQQALVRTATESSNSDLRLFAAAVAIQLRSGGNLADMMQQLAMVISDRIRLARRMKTLMAQTQFSKRILIAMPLFMFVLLSAIRPDYMRPLYESTSGQAILGGAILSMAFGAWIMNLIARVRY